MKVYPPRDIRPFVMYCVNGKPRSSLLIESTDSMIRVFRAAVNTYVSLPIFWGLDARGGKNYEQAHTHMRDNHSNDNNNESTEVQTLGVIRIQL